MGLLDDNLITFFIFYSAPLVRLQNTIRDLRLTIKDQEKETKYAEDGMEQADADAREKDKQLTEALTRMSEYEAVSNNIAYMFGKLLRLTILHNILFKTRLRLIKTVSTGTLLCTNHFCFAKIGYQQLYSCTPVISCLEEFSGEFSA